MSWQESLVFLCNCLHPYSCMLGFANVVGLLLEYMCLHTEVECGLCESEIGSHDSCLTEVVDCVLMVDMSLRRESGHCHTYGRQSVRIAIRTGSSCSSAELRQEVKTLEIPKLTEIYGVTNLRSRPLSMAATCACLGELSVMICVRHSSIKSSCECPQAVVVLLKCDGISSRTFAKSLARHASRIRIQNQVNQTT